VADRLGRFLKLERARPADVRGAADEERAGPVDAQSAASELQRLRAEQLESGMVLDEQARDEQPFTRCGQCETDNNRSAGRCANCSADLRTPMQRAFNQQLWDTRRAEMRAEQERAREPAGANLHEAQRQRALGEALARQVAERETERLRWMDRGARVELGWGASTAGRIYFAIPTPLGRWTLSMATAAAAALLGWFSFGPRHHDALARVCLVLLAAHFLPLRRDREPPGGG